MFCFCEHKQSILNSMADNFQIATLVFLAPCFAFFLPRFLTVRQPAFAAHVRLYWCVGFSHTFYSRMPLRRREFNTTLTLLNAIARPAKTGERSHPNSG